MVLKRFRASLLIGVLLFLLLPLSAQAQADAVTMTAVVGFDNFYTENQWIPVHVTVTNDGPAIDGYIDISAENVSNDVERYRAPIVLPTQSKKQVTLYVFPETYVSNMRIRLHTNGDNQIVQQINQKNIRSLEPGDILYGVVSDQQVNLDVLETVKVELTAGDEHDASVAYLGLDDLPENGAAWQGLDVLVFAHFDSNQLTPSQRQQIRTWVETGGHLVVMGGIGAQQTAAAFADILPVTVLNNQTVADIASLGLSLGMELAEQGAYLVTETQLKNGEVLLRNDDLPILVRNERGSGFVSYIAFDPELEPLQNSRVSQALWDKVAVTTGQPTIWEKGWINMYSAEEAARVFPELSPPSVLGLAAFLLIYIIAIGPLNYFVLKRIGRRELAWFTIPAIIGLFLAVAYFTGFRWRGQDVLVNQLSLAAGSADSDTVKVETIIGVYSPRRNSYDISFADDALVRLGDNDYRSGGSGSSNSSGYSERGGENKILDLRINTADARSLRATSYRPALAIDGTVTLAADGNSIAVDLYNDSDIDLKDATLFLGIAAVQIPDLDAGKRLNDTFTLSFQARKQFARITESPANEASSVIAISTAVNNELATAELVPGDRWGYDQSAEDYMRYQFVESVLPGWYSGPGSGESLYIPRHKIALTGWSDELAVEMDIADTSSRTSGITLHIIEIPVGTQ